MDSKKRCFAEGLGFYKLVWIFVIGAVIGFAMETVWFLLLHGEYMSRKGVFYGPFSPIYGFGALLITVVLWHFKDKNASIIFVVSGLLGAGFEYICSFLQEKFMGTVSWDYSNKPFNLHGRTSLNFAILWGCLGLIFIKHTFPYLSNLIEKIPIRAGTILTWFLFIFLIFDMAISVIGVHRQTQRREGIPSTSAFTEFLDTLYPDEYIDNIYTRVKVVDRQKP